jgi:hypothetical protein
VGAELITCLDHLRNSENVSGTDKLKTYCTDIPLRFQSQAELRGEEEIRQTSGDGYKTSKIDCAHHKHVMLRHEPDRMV